MITVSRRENAINSYLTWIRPFNRLDSQSHPDCGSPCHNALNSRISRAFIRSRPTGMEIN